MVILKCQKCGAQLQWDGTGNVMRCGNCQTEYMIHPRSETFRRARKQDPYTGRGEVQGIPIVPGNDCSGLCPIESFAPKGWHICSRQASDEFYGDHASNPFVAEEEYVSPDGSARILFRGSNIYTDALEQIRQSLLQYLQALKNQTAMAIHQQEMASWDRRQQIISDTHNYTMNVMHQMNANTAATHQRVANLHSESIRGVNTYYTARPGSGVPDVVEADVRWDNVYQNTVDPSIFVASESYWLEPGVDFEPLIRTNGQY